jgi:hypothetical protein
VTEGLLLVSPRIFSAYARQCADDGDPRDPTSGSDEAGLAKSIQRQVLRAGWHLRLDRGVNIVTYQVMRGTRPVAQLSGIVLRDPARLIRQVPPVNPRLLRLAAQVVAV